MLNESGKCNYETKITTNNIETKMIFNSSLKSAYSKCL